MLKEYLITFFISMVPLVELRVAIPYSQVVGLPWAFLIFVGIPLPGTGAWTGTLEASILDMDFSSSVLACMGGVLLAGIIMAVAGIGVLGTLGTIF